MEIKHVNNEIFIFDVSKMFKIMNIHFKLLELLYRCLGNILNTINIISISILMAYTYLLTK